MILKNDEFTEENDGSLILDNTIENKKDELILEEDRITDSIIVDRNKDEDYVLDDTKNGLFSSPITITLFCIDKPFLSPI